MVTRLTKPTARVLQLLLKAPQEGAYGLELSRDANVGNGTLYPMLIRLERLGWVESSWEAIDPADAGRPARRYYRLTGLGRIEAVAVLERNPAVGLDGLAEA